MPVNLGAAAILGGGSLLSGLLGSNAAQTAARQQAQTTQAGINAQLGVDQIIQQQLSPWLGAGQNALYNLQQQLGTAPGTAPGMAPAPGLFREAPRPREDTRACRAQWPS